MLVGVCGVGVLGVGVPGPEIPGVAGVLVGVSCGVPGCEWDPRGDICGVVDLECGCGGLHGVG